MDKHIEETLEIFTSEEAFTLFGRQDEHLKLIRDSFGVEIVARNDVVKISGESAKVKSALLFASNMLTRIRNGELITTAKFARSLSPHIASTPKEESAEKIERAILYEKGSIRARTSGQQKYISAMQENEITLSIGPAGTGKTFLAVLMAIKYLQSGDVRKIALVRPAVEAGEKLGFLPGDYQAKVNPYLRPLYDSLYYLLDADAVKRYMERDIIEICPLAYMRGRTLSNAFVILDEAQNTTSAQMKMFLTRMGEKSRMVVTGDITQIDLPKPSDSGLIRAFSILKGIDGIGLISLTKKDVVRHRLVGKILEAYENSGEKDYR